jgi:hypothetical protein
MDHHYLYGQAHEGLLKEEGNNRRWQQEKQREKADVEKKFSKFQIFNLLESANKNSEMQQSIVQSQSCTQRQSTMTAASTMHQKLLVEHQQRTLSLLPDQLVGWVMIVLRRIFIQ